MYLFRVMLGFLLCIVYTSNVNGNVFIPTDMNFSKKILFHKTKHDRSNLGKFISIFIVIYKNN